MTEEAVLLRRNVPPKQLEAEFDSILEEQFEADQFVIQYMPYFPQYSLRVFKQNDQIRAQLLSSETGSPIKMATHGAQHTEVTISDDTKQTIARVFEITNNPEIVKEAVIDAVMTSGPIHTFLFSLPDAPPPPQPGRFTSDAKKFIAESSPTLPEEQEEHALVPTGVPAHEHFLGITSPLVFTPMTAEERFLQDTGVRDFLRRREVTPQELRATATRILEAFGWTRSYMIQHPQGRVEPVAQAPEPRDADRHFRRFVEEHPERIIGADIIRTDIKESKDVLTPLSLINVLMSGKRDRQGRIHITPTDEAEVIMNAQALLEKGLTTDDVRNIASRMLEQRRQFLLRDIYTVPSKERLDKLYKEYKQRVKK